MGKVSAGAPPAQSISVSGCSVLPGKSVYELFLGNDLSNQEAEWKSNELWFLTVGG